MTAVYFGCNFPFLGGSQKVLSRQEDKRLISNDLQQLLLTTPGERVHRPTFGTPLRTSLFEPLTAPVLSELEEAILSAISKEEPRLTDVIVNLTVNKDDNFLGVAVIGKLSFSPSTEFLFRTQVPLPLPT